jgi:hypothetical protein
MNTGNFLFYKTPVEQFKESYGHFEQPFKSKISTQLPKNIALIRVVATLVFTTWIAVTSSPVWLWTVVIAGTTFAGWTIYSHLLRRDPLVDVFYKIVGGKNHYDNLPEIHLVGEKHISESMKEVSWDKLNQPIYKAKTTDGRKILIVKALTHNPEQHTAYAQVKTLFVFVEKAGPNDYKPNISNLSPKNSRLLESIFYALRLWDNKNPFGAIIYFDSQVISKINGEKVQRNDACYVYGFMNKDIANEFSAQLNAQKG